MDLMLSDKSIGTLGMRIIFRKLMYTYFLTMFSFISLEPASLCMQVP